MHSFCGLLRQPIRDLPSSQDKVKSMQQCIIEANTVLSQASVPGAFNSISSSVAIKVECKKEKYFYHAVICCFCVTSAIELTKHFLSRGIFATLRNNNYCASFVSLGFSSILKCAIKLCLTFRNCFALETEHVRDSIKRCWTKCLCAAKSQRNEIWRLQWRKLGAFSEVHWTLYVQSPFSG